jgi:hypothetical protein
LLSVSLKLCLEHVLVKQRNTVGCSSKFNSLLVKILSFKGIPFYFSC